MLRPGVIGVGVGGPADNPAEAAVVVYIDQTMGRDPVLPESLDNVKVRIVRTEPFRAYW
jgi:hypothetical protein